jgi:hypothetical protein
MRLVSQRAAGPWRPAHDGGWWIIRSSFLSKPPGNKSRLAATCSLRLDRGGQQRAREGDHARAGGRRRPQSAPACRLQPDVTDSAAVSALSNREHGGLMAAATHTSPIIAHVHLILGDRSEWRQQNGATHERDFRKQSITRFPIARLGKCSKLPLHHERLDLSGTPDYGLGVPGTVKVTSSKYPMSYARPLTVKLQSGASPLAIWANGFAKHWYY